MKAKFVAAKSRRLLRHASVLALTVSSLGLAAAPSLAAPTTGWGIPVTDVTPDPDVRQGRLPNGMKYAIMRNAVPQGAASVRLHFDFGSIGERENERGLAHFIEHMAFNGTTHVPEGEMTKMLERQGLKFGPDTNAVTTFDFTMYMLDLPQSDPARLDTAFMLMREAASEVQFDPAAVDRERGVLLGERRFREDHNFKRLVDVINFRSPLAPYGTRLPIGTPEVLKGAPAATIKDLYRRYYRPENATFIFVGDADPAMIEQRIRKTFSDWKGVDGAGSELPRGTVDFNRPLSFDTFVDPAIPSIVSISSYRPWEDPADTVAERRRQVVRQFAAAMLNRRIQRIANAPDSVILGGGMGTDSLQDVALESSIDVITKDGEWKQGLKIAENELRKALRFGFLKSELDVVRADLQGKLRTQAEQAKARTSPALAQEIANSISGNDLITSPAWDLAFFSAQAPSITVAEVNAELKRLWSGSKPLVHVSAKQAIDTAQLAAAFSGATAVAVKAPVEAAAKAFAYDSFGTPGKVVSDTQIADLGLREIRFANNVRLNIKKTEFEPGKIGYAVRMDGGQLALPRDKPGLGLMVANVSALAATRQHDLEELKTLTSGKQVNAGMAVTYDAFSASGTTNREDLALQMKLAAAYLMDPGFRPEAQTQWATIIPLFLKQVEAQPKLMFDTKLPHLLAARDARIGFPDGDELAKRSLAEFKAIYPAIAAKAPIEVTIVGDVDEAAAIATVANTFGALPARGAPVDYDAARVVQWGATREPILLTHTGAADQTLVGGVWRTDDDADYRTEVGLEMLDNLMSLLLTETVREKLGASYGSSIDSSMSETFKDFGYFAVSSIVAPDKADIVDQAIAEAAKTLRDTSIDKDLLDRARNPAVESARRDLRRNAYWLGALAQAQSKPERLDRARQRIAILESLAPAELHRLAQTYLTPDRFTRVRISSATAAAK